MRSWPTLPLGIQLRAWWDTFADCLALWRYAVRHWRVLKIAPVGVVFRRQLFFTGVEAWGIVAVFAFLSGALVITQTLSLVGADSDVAVKVLVWTIVREVGPLFAAIIIVARSSAAIASELALMKVRGEMTQLSRMRIPPLDYLIVPRIFGVALAVVALTIYFQVVAIAGGLAVSALFQNVSWLDQFGKFLATVTLGEFLLVAFKGCLFGIGISTISCHNGLHAELSVTQVPKVAIRAVLQSLLFVFTLDALIAYFSMAA